MGKLNLQVSFRALGQLDQVPYELLLLADPSRELVDAYLKHSEIYVATLQDNIYGVIVLTYVSHESMEIKNLAVRPELHGKGIGSFLINEAIQRCADRNLKSILIGTADSSLRQLALYKRLGFKVIEIRKDFFVDNYSEPIFEDGVQARDMVVLQKDLQTNKYIYSFI